MFDELQFWWRVPSILVSPSGTSRLYRAVATWAQFLSCVSLFGETFWVYFLRMRRRRNEQSLLVSILLQMPSIVQLDQLRTTGTMKHAYYRGALANDCLRAFNVHILAVWILVGVAIMFVLLQNTSWNRWMSTHWGKIMALLPLFMLTLCKYPSTQLFWSSYRHG